MFSGWIGTMTVGQEPQGTPPRCLQPPAQDKGPSGEPILYQDRQINLTEALYFLDSVKAEFPERQDVYDQFMDILKDFKSRRVDTLDAMERLKQLFHGHPMLIQGFNTFLPPGYHIAYASNSPNPTVISMGIPSWTVAGATDGNFQHGSVQSEPALVPIPEPLQRCTDEDFLAAYTYLAKVKSRTSCDPERCRRFMSLLYPANYPPDRPLAKTFQILAADICKDDADLLEEFYEFLRKWRPCQTEELSVPE